VRYRLHKCLIHLIAVAALHQAQIDPSLGRYSPRPVAMRTGTVEELSTSATSESLGGPLLLQIPLAAKVWQGALLQWPVPPSGEVSC
jgi:hypothetical protein